MKTHALLLLALCIGCTANAPTPTTRLASCRVKTDLGFLDDPTVQKKVALREEHRKRIKPLNDRFNQAALRLVAIAQIFMQTEHVSASCPNETRLFHFSADGAPGELLAVQRRGTEVIRLIDEAGTYAAKDGAERDIASLERAVSRFELTADLASGSLKRLLRCKGIEVRVLHPVDGTVLFDTGSDEDRLTPVLQTL